jgi:hypothetical protein
LRDVAVPRLRIAILSDFHANRPFMGPGALSAAGRPDCKACGGHDPSARGLRRSCHRRAEPVARGSDGRACAARAPLGVFAVFGNHDWRNDPAPEPGSALPTIWHRAFDAAGMTVLSNDVLRWRWTAPFQLAGLESQRAFKLRNPRRVRGEDDFPR